MFRKIFLLRLLLIMDALNLAKVTVNTFTMLQKIYQINPVIFNFLFINKN